MDQRVNILSLDGGGVRGLSTLYILKQVMEEVDRHNPPKPCEYFDLIGGTGSGGVIAILLGRLKMDIDPCIDVYCRLMKQAFKQRFLSIGSKSPRLDDVFKSILNELGYPNDTLLQESNASCKVMSYVLDKRTKQTIPLSNFHSTHCPHDLSFITIRDALQASMAHPSFSTPLRLGLDKRHITDASLAANNPIRHIWTEATEIWSSLLENQLGCLVSIGTGVPSIKQLHTTGSGRHKTSQNGSINAEITAESFIREHTELDDENRHFRFSVPNGMADIGPDRVREIQTIIQATKDHTVQELVHKQIKRCAQALSERDVHDDTIEASSPYSPVAAYPGFSQWIFHENSKIDTFVSCENSCPSPNPVQIEAEIPDQKDHEKHLHIQKPFHIGNKISLGLCAFVLGIRGL